MPRRMGRPGLVGTMARTAVIAGTATAVSGSVQQKQAGQAQAAAEQQAAQQAAFESQAQLAEMQAQMQAMQSQQAAATAPAAPAGGGDITSKLKELGELKAAGVLTDEEFAAAKAKLLS
jgi:hypothetical protein